MNGDWLMDDEAAVRPYIWIILLALVPLTLAASMWWASHQYGDWTCAFDTCVRVIVR